MTRCDCIRPHDGRFGAKKIGHAHAHTVTQTSVYSQFSQGNAAEFHCITTRGLASRLSCLSPTRSGNWILCGVISQSQYAATRHADPAIARRLAGDASV